MDSSLSSLSLSSPTQSTAWDSLKKQARKYESQAYTKLTEYSRQAASINSLTSAAISAHSSQSGSASSQTIIAEADACSNIESEISDLLSKLSSTADEMNKIITSEPNNQSAVNETNSYTLQRYRAILHDYTAEYRKTKESIAAARQRAELLLPSHANEKESLLNGTSQSLRPRTDQLIREKNSLHTSLRITDELIQQAADSHSSLQNQSAMFTSIRSRVSGLRSRFPVVNTLIGRIERQRQKDVIVMASVISVCIIFTFLYIINKPSA